MLPIKKNFILINIQKSSNKKSLGHKELTLLVMVKKASFLIIYKLKCILSFYNIILFSQKLISAFIHCNSKMNATFLKVIE